MPATKKAAVEAAAVVEPETQPVDPFADVKFPVDAKTTARIIRADARFAGGKVTDKAVRRLVREHDIAGLDDDKYTRHAYDRATLETILETYFAPAARREAQVASDVTDEPAQPAAETPAA
jgi:hypothetical protein